MPLESSPVDVGVFDAANLEVLLQDFNDMEVVFKLLEADLGIVWVFDVPFDEEVF